MCTKVLPRAWVHELTPSLASSSLADVWLSYCRVQAAKRVGLMMHLPVVSACLQSYVKVYLRYEGLTCGVLSCLSVQESKHAREHANTRANMPKSMREGERACERACEIESKRDTYACVREYV